jgi:hypothetical protein
MIRVAIAAALVLPCAALAQGDDLAVVACEMLVREELPNNLSYRRLSGEIAGSAVALRYETADSTGRATRRQMRCAFTFNASTAAWGFAGGASSDSAQVAVMGALAHRGSYPIPREMTALQPPP